MSMFRKPDHPAAYGRYDQRARQFRCITCNELVIPCGRWEDADGNPNSMGHHWEPRLRHAWNLRANSVSGGYPPMCDWRDANNFALRTYQAWHNSMSPPARYTIGEPMPPMLPAQYEFHRYCEEQGKTVSEVIRDAFDFIEEQEQKRSQKEK